MLKLWNCDILFYFRLLRLIKTSTGSMPAPQQMYRSASSTSMTTRRSFTCVDTPVYMRVTSQERSLSTPWALFPSTWLSKIWIRWEKESQKKDDILRQKDAGFLDKEWINDQGWIFFFGFSQISKTKLILEGEDKDVFSVEPATTMSTSIVQLLVKQSQKLDYEVTQQMVLQVRTIRYCLGVCEYD